MPDYKNGKIYAIRSHQTDKIYIGSTVDTLSRRMTGHRSNYKQYKNKNNKYNFISSFNILEFDDAYIELLENCSCNSKEELLKREGELIRKTTCVNKCIPDRTQKEWYQDNKEKLNEYRKINKEKIVIQTKKYREANKEKIKKYRKDNKEEIKKYRKEYQTNNKEKRKEYSKKNKEKVAIQTKKYREDNKEQIQKYRNNNKEKLKEKIKCDCGIDIQKNSIYNHIRSKKHIQKMKIELLLK